MFGAGVCASWLEGDKFQAIKNYLCKRVGKNNDLLFINDLISL
jgi:hypothetical protein